MAEVDTNRVTTWSEGKPTEGQADEAKSHNQPPAPNKCTPVVASFHLSPDAYRCVPGEAVQANSPTR